MTELAPPRRIGVAGDWHGNTLWAIHAVRQMAPLLDHDRPKIILHLGDFGIWPGSKFWPGGKRDYLTRLDATLEEEGAWLEFIDGNHEDFAQIDSWRDAGDMSPMVVPGTRRIIHLPRGHRWNWHGREWLAIGGAVSPDRALRVENQTWWPQEAITDDQVRLCLAGGHADVIVSHDAPTDVPIRYLNPPPRAWALSDLERSEQNRARLQEIIDGTGATLNLHAHHHQGSGYWRDVPFGQAASFDMSGEDGNWRILNIETMEMG